MEALLKKALDGCGTLAENTDAKGCAGVAAESILAVIASITEMELRLVQRQHNRADTGVTEILATQRAAACDTSR